MKRFAEIQDGVVVNVILADDEFALACIDSGVVLIETAEVDEDFNKVACIGDKYEDGKFISVPKPNQRLKV